MASFVCAMLCTVLLLGSKRRRGSWPAVTERSGCHRCSSCRALWELRGREGIREREKVWDLLFSLLLSRAPNSRTSIESVISLTSGDASGSSQRGGERATEGITIACGDDTHRCSTCRHTLVLERGPPLKSGADTMMWVQPSYNVCKHSKKEQKHEENNEQHHW
uniref:Secreted protein n=1 Tax=Oryza nivara TaxID=4536 RepID=A0A0E0G4H2_ORYNI